MDWASESVIPAIKGKRIDRSFFTEGEAYKAIIYDSYKLIMMNESFNPSELYNLETDPKEKQNLIDEEPELVAHLENEFKDYR